MRGALAEGVELETNLLCLLENGLYPPTLSDLIEELLDQVAGAVDIRAEADRLVAIDSRRDFGQAHRLAARALIQSASHRRWQAASLPTLRHLYAKSLSAGDAKRAKMHFRRGPYCLLAFQTAS
jgi:hypothetical protein